MPLMGNKHRVDGQVDGGYKYTVTYTTTTGATSTLAQIITTSSSSTYTISAPGSSPGDPYLPAASTECWYKQSATEMQPVGASSSFAISAEAILDSSNVVLCASFHDAPTPTRQSAVVPAGGWTTTPPTTAEGMTTQVFQGTDAVTNDTLLIGLELSADNHVLGVAWGLQASTPPSTVQPSGTFTWASTLPTLPTPAPDMAFYWATSFWTSS